jgi:hypothetical protein
MTGSSSIREPILDILAILLLSFYKWQQLTFPGQEAKIGPSLGALLISTPLPKLETAPVAFNAELMCTTKGKPGSSHVERSQKKVGPSVSSTFIDY